jgi:hypothetical protein
MRAESSARPVSPGSLGAMGTDGEQARFRKSDSL